MRLEERIKQLRINRNMTMQQLADLSNLTKGYISMLEKGLNPSTKKPIVPSLETVQNLANAFNMNLEELLDGVEGNVSLTQNDSIMTIYTQLTSQRQERVYNYAEEQLNEQNNVVNINDYIEEETEWYEVKFYGSVSAGTGLYLDDEQVETISFGSDMVPSGTDFCLKVNGDSMEPMFNNGDYVFIKRETDFRNGTIGAVIVNGEAYLKKIYITDNSIRLVSLNKKYKDITVTQDDNLKYVGTVVF